MYVGYLGPSGSFTHNAALKAFPEAELVSLGTITEVIKSYEEGRVDYAVIPVENSIEGSVHESLDYLFHQADIRAVAEIVQPIKQQLMATKHHEKIEKIFSHPQAIEKNYTRFWVLGNTVPEIPLNQIDCKLTLALTLPDNMPGALYKALSTFAWRGIDLTKIESRPLKTVLGEYFFIIDCDYTKEKLAQFALEELTAVGIGYKILGAYQVYEI